MCTRVCRLMSSSLSVQYVSLGSRNVCSTTAVCTVVFIFITPVERQLDLYMTLHCIDQDLKVKFNVSANFQYPPF